jgi:hypothetical protein
LSNVQKGDKGEKGLDGLDGKVDIDLTNIKNDPNQNVAYILKKKLGTATYTYDSNYKYLDPNVDIFLTSNYVRNDFIANTRYELKPTLTGLP